MPDLTPRLGIKKPLGTENVTRDSFNANWDIIDSKVATVGSDGKVPTAQLPAMDFVQNTVKGQPNGVATLGSDGKVTATQQPDASLTAKGLVQLTSSTASTSETLAATAKAVKLAMDQANAAFTSANNGKTDVANAISAKGVSASSADTFTVLASKIGQINTGKKWASGTVSSSASVAMDEVINSTTTVSITPSGMVQVTGLTFKPSYIMIYKGGQYDILETIYAKDMSAFGNPNGNILYGSKSYSQGSAFQYVVSSAGNGVAITSTGFTLPYAKSGDSAVNWIAFE